MQALGYLYRVELPEGLVHAGCCARASNNVRTLAASIMGRDPQACIVELDEEAQRPVAASAPQALTKPQAGESHAKLIGSGCWPPGPRPRAVC